MKRNFNKKQRLALAKASSWKCAICGDPLPDNFHADHIIPYSKGGCTDVANGQALCPLCNLKKGNRMINLRPWQKQAQDTTINEFHNGKDKVLIKVTPGAGKTIYGLDTYNKLSKNYTHLVIVSPSTVVKDMWIEEANKLYNIPLYDDILYSGKGNYGDYAGMSITYQKLMESTEDFKYFMSKNRVLIIADEVHHLSEGEHKRWSTAFKTIAEYAENVIMMTGTPWTSEGLNIPYVEYENGYAIGDHTYSMKDAIADGFCRYADFPLHRGTSVTYVDDDGVISEKTIEEAEAEGKNVYSHMIRKDKALEALFTMADMKLSDLRSGNLDTAGGLIVAANIQTARSFREKIERITGVEYPIVHSDQKGSHSIIKDFKKNNGARWIISVGMVAEGVDIKRLQVCIFLSSFLTELFFLQVLGRILRRRWGKYDGEYWGEKSLRTTGKIDETAYFYCLENEKLLGYINKIMIDVDQGRELKEEGEKEKEPGDGDGGGKMEIESGLLDFDLEQSGMIHNGNLFEHEILARAYEIKKRNESYFDLPDDILCRIAIAEIAAESGAKEDAYQDNVGIPIVEQNKIFRKQISKEINFKLARAGLIKDNRSFRDANYFINNRFNVVKRDEASMDQLENMLEYVKDTEAEQWL